MSAISIQANSARTIASRFNLLWLAAGSGLLLFTTWHWNIALAAWIAPLFLMRYFRNQKAWYLPLLALPPMAAVSFANKHAAWGFDLWTEFAVAVLAILPLFLALYADRAAVRKLPPLWATLVFPSVYVTLDYLVSLLPFGTVLSLAVTQFQVIPLIQIASIAGVWGISFLVTWFASVVNALWEQEFHFEKALPSILIYGAVLGVTLLYGSARVALTPPAAATVRVAGITVGHARNYWDEIVDLNTPRDRTAALAPELTALEDKLFAQSEQAAQSGAKVIFWSEGDAILLPERQAGFVQRAQAFARDHQVYFVPATMTFRYGEATGDNQLLMIKPDGSIAFPYTKTMSWYPTDSDGVIHTVETPYGRIAASICFDMDFPNFIRQAAQQRADIMLVPAYDTFGTHPYHTEVGLLRSVEEGMAVMRQTNEGTSMAVDANGNLLAVQDFFSAQQPILIADLPTRGVRTLYGVLGDWLAYLAIGLSIGLLVAAVIRKPRSS